MSLGVRRLDAGDVDAFVEVAFELQGADPGWVPPLRAVQRRELVGPSAFFAHGRVCMFFAELGGRRVGRIAALVNDRLRSAGGTPIGQLGYFECEDRKEVARALVDEACAWLAGEGASEAWGPMNGGAHRLHRLQMSGFDREPFLFEPRNPPSHVELLQESGLAPVHLWHTFELRLSELSELLEGRGFARAVERAARRYVIDPLETTEVEATLACVHPLLDRVWAGHAGYAPLDPGELAETFTGLLAVTSRRWACIIRDGDSDVGLSFMYPDLAPEVRALAGDASGFGRWPPPADRRRMVMHTVAFVPEVRGTGAPFVGMAGGMAHMREDGLDEVVVALVDETFPVFSRIAEPTRSYALLARRL